MDDGMSGDRKRQIRLGEMTVWILGAAVFFAMVRGATGFWGNPVPVLSLDRVVGVGLLAIASVMVGRLTAGAIARGSVFGRAWRWLAGALLVAMRPSLPVQRRK